MGRKRGSAQGFPRFVLSHITWFFCFFVFLTLYVLELIDKEAKYFVLNCRQKPSERHSIDLAPTNISHLSLIPPRVETPQSSLWLPPFTCVLLNYNEFAALPPFNPQSNFCSALSKFTMLKSALEILKIIMPEIKQSFLYSLSPSLCACVCLSVPVCLS